MSVLDRSDLEASPLADLYTIASELGIDSFRRLRKEALVDAILDRQSGSEPSAESGSESGGGEASAPADAETADADADDADDPADAESGDDAEDDDDRPRRRR